jgi:TonB family protein
MNRAQVRLQIQNLLIILACIAHGTLSLAAQQTPSKAPSGLQDLAVQAIHVVVSQEVLNSFSPEPKTGKPLSTKGKWLVVNQAPSACPKTTESCVKVLYRVPEAEVSCEWVVLLEGDGSQGNILEQNRDASQYFVQKLNHRETTNQVLVRKMPTYPPIALAAHVTGLVELQVIVDQDGKPSNVTIVRGPEMLRASSIDALKAWKFKPLIVGSNGIPFQTVVTFTFLTSGPPVGSVTSNP